MRLCVCLLSDGSGGGVGAPLWGNATAKHHAFLTNSNMCWRNNITAKHQALLLGWDYTQNKMCGSATIKCVCVCVCAFVCCVCVCSNGESTSKCPLLSLIEFCCVLARPCLLHLLHAAPPSSAPPPSAPPPSAPPPSFADPPAISS